MQPNPEVHKNGSAAESISMGEEVKVVKDGIEKEIDDVNTSTEIEKSTFRYEEIVDHSLWLNIKLPLFGLIRFNPVVSTFSILLIWLFVITCITIKPSDLPFDPIKKWIVQNFTWLYIGSQDVWAIFAIVLYFSKYSSIKMGKDHEKPEYNDATWFMMLFACGIGTGLFFYGVAEPVAHYTQPNRYYEDRAMPDNTLAQNAMNVTLYHWGIHGWIVYCLIGMLLGLISYREELPMTMKSCFYPLIGDKIFGWIGDLIDTVSVLTTLFGVCTSLGLGTKQLSKGLNTISGSSDINSQFAQVIIIWVITVIATISTVSGVGMGIRRLSEICFLLGVFLMVITFIQTSPMFILNLFVQSMGYYFQYIIQLGFHCDAFEQAGPNGGVEDRERLLPEKNPPSQEAVRDWMDNYTMFYWGWWISWSPFVGMFIAKISRGRTIKEFINGTLTAPVLYSFLWLVIFGGNGLLLERQSAAEGYCCPKNDGDKAFLNFTNMKDVIEDRNMFDQRVFSTSSSFLCHGTEGCGPCSASFIAKKEGENVTYGDLLEEYQLVNEDFARSSPDRKFARISCVDEIEKMWFDVMLSFGDIGQTFSVISLIGIVLYFVTSSDSGSLVIDCLTSNGDPDPPRIQRVFWALMEGATATALIVAGGENGLTTLRTAGLISGLPYTFVVCLLCVSLWRYVKMVKGDLNVSSPKFAISLFDPFFTSPYKNWTTKTLKNTIMMFFEWVSEIFLTPLTVGRAAGEIYDCSVIIQQCLLGTFMTLTVAFLISSVAFTGSLSLAFWWYLCFVVHITIVRIKARDKLQIVEGNAAEDFFASLFMYPSVSLQLKYTLLKSEETESQTRNGEKYTMSKLGEENPNFAT